MTKSSNSAAELTADQRLAQVTARLLGHKMPEDFKFSMSEFRTSIWSTHRDGICGTRGCIAGLAVFMFGTHDEFEDSSTEEFKKRAREILGLTYHQSEKIFCSNSVHSALTDINDTQAGRVLARYMQTGIIDWGLKDRPVTVAGRKF